MPGLWVTPDDLREDLGSQAAYAYEACQAASELLWSLSGRRFSGRQTVTEHYELPVRRAVISYATAAVPVLDHGSIRNWVTAVDDEPSPCNGHRHVRLSGTPINAVSEVKIGARTLSRSEYWVEGSARLALAALDACELEVTYTYGAPPPAAGRQAARYLAEQFVMSWTGDEECALPAHVTSVTRQGLSYSISDEQVLVEKARTGIYSVDLFLKSVNPDGARRRSRVFSPDVPRGRRVTRTASTAVATHGPFDLEVVPGRPCVWTIDLTAANASLVASDGYAPRGQVTGWNGATWLTADSGRFTIIGNALTCTLTADETRSAQIIGNSTWDLYAVVQADESTVVHVLTSNVWLKS